MNRVQAGFALTQPDRGMPALPRSWNRGRLPLGIPAEL